MKRRLFFTASALFAACTWAGGCSHLPGPNGVQPVAFVVPQESLYVGSYRRVPIPRELGPFGALRFRVREGPAGGTVSESRDETFSLREPDVMLIAGYQPGEYRLEALDSAGTVVSSARFVVTVRVPRGGLGPSLVSQGMRRAPAAGTAWGGGPGGVQNVGTHPTRAVHRIALIFVDTNEQRYSTDAPTFDGFRQNWRRHIIDGATIAGVARSVRRYYQEGSQGAMDIQMETFGPYHLDGNWDEVGAGAGWVGHAQAAITAADPDVDYTRFNTVLVVSQSVPPAGMAPWKFAWPTASIGEWGGWVTGDASPVLGSIQMPNDWTDRDGRQVYATASHELGHNLGLGDQYTPVVAGRNPGAWELMHSDGALPGFSLFHKLGLGWINPAWVRAFNFASLGTPVDETVNLAASAGGAPPAGRFVGVEVRISDGLNYYFEYRRADPARIADAALPMNERVLGTDAYGGSVPLPVARPAILLLANDPDGDGPVLGNGANYRETDHSSPIFPVEFQADASGIGGAAASLRIRYGVNEKPDPSIRPWGAPPWQTPDIEVRNTRNAVDPAWFNVPWVGHANDVVAKVKNSGGVSAPGVRVEFYVKNYNVGGAPEIFLGAENRDIPAGGTVEFHQSWTPPASGHFCIIVRIPLYLRPGAPVVAELTELNNSAQSNYDRFISATASPAERKITQIEVGNPYDLPARVYLGVDQTNPLYRTYLEHRWVDLGANERRKVTVMMEFVGTAPAAFEGRVDPRQYSRVENRVSLTAHVVDPRDSTRHRMVLLGGADMSVATGRATRFEAFDYLRGTVRGRVVQSDGSPVPSGTVIVTVTAGDSLYARHADVQARIGPNGTFAVELPQTGRGEAQGYYVPTAGFGDATSNRIRISP
jgi:M6 family metalloprotease-like protein